MLSRGDTWWQVVLVPIIVGMFANYKFPKTVRCAVPNRLPIGATTRLPCLQVKKIEPFSPVVGVLSTCILVGSAVAQCAAPIKAAGLSLQLACATVRLSRTFTWPSARHTPDTTARARPSDTAAAACCRWARCLLRMQAARLQ